MSIKVKTGMAGSKNGRSRWDTTEVLKSISKKRRRSIDKEAIKNSYAGGE